ncbi:hypothetical protein [Paraburkholderia sp. SIMBA_054]|uniref:hypothetical protein n=1 Tax=Paraburkholderia sp. SIMBA_054 TaxID=3085795 RepID=UPI00397ACE4A
MMYFDAMTQLGIGTFVSRITFGLQDGSATQVNPSVTVVMPTSSLHLLAREIVKALDNPEHRKRMRAAFDQYDADFPPLEA